MAEKENDWKILPMPVDIVKQFLADNEELVQRLSQPDQQYQPDENIEGNEAIGEDEDEDEGEDYIDDVVYQNVENDAVQNGQML